MDYDFSQDTFGYGGASFMAGAAYPGFGQQIRKPNYGFVSYPSVAPTVAAAYAGNGYPAGYTQASQNNFTGGPTTQPASTTPGGFRRRGWGRGRGRGRSSQSGDGQPKAEVKLIFCEVCKITCGTQDVFDTHLAGIKHKKKLAQQQTIAAEVQGPAPKFKCDLCDIGFVSADHYNSHLLGAKHAKVVSTYEKLGRDVPLMEPIISSAKTAPQPQQTQQQKSVTGQKMEMAVMAGGDDGPQLVGEGHITAQITATGRVAYACSLCGVTLTDESQKLSHLRGQRHQLQYKFKIDPSYRVPRKGAGGGNVFGPSGLLGPNYQVNLDPGLIPELEPPPGAMEWIRQRGGVFFPFHQPMMRPYGMHPGAPPMPMRPPVQFARPYQSYLDRSIMAKHTKIYPNEKELESFQKIVKNVEAALKASSDQLAEDGKDQKVANAPSNGEAAPESAESKPPRLLKGVMRVGLLAKGLLLSCDKELELVLLCNSKPTQNVLLKVYEILPKHLQTAAPEEKYITKLILKDAALVVSDTKEPHLSIKILMTSPAFEPPAESAKGAEEIQVEKDPPNMLNKEKCLQALTALQQAKWFQEKVRTDRGLIVVRVLRDLVKREPAWAPLTPWALEVLVEKVLCIYGDTMQASDLLGHVLESVASGIVLQDGGFGLKDPCGKELSDVTANLIPQEREELTASAQKLLRMFHFFKIHEILDIERPPRKRPWEQRGETNQDKNKTEGDEKKVKVDETPAATK